MNRNDASRTVEYEQHELEHAPMMHSNVTPVKDSHARESQVSEDDDFEAKQPAPKLQFSRWIILARSLILIPPIIITIVILVLNFRKVFWMLPTTGFNTILGALQFAAQVHASLMVASISMMVLNMIQHGLASKKGLPLGMLSANFYVDSPTWLFRTEFKSLGLKYTLIFPWVVALAVLSAPSSAIVMLPRLQFWTLSNIWLGKDDMKFGVYIEASPTSLYPEMITSAMSAPQCAGANASLLSECPSYGFRSFLLKQDLFTSTSFVNITMSAKWNRYLIGHGKMFNRGTHNSYLTSSLSVFLGDAMLGYHDVLSSISSQYFGIDGGKSTVQYEDEKLRARYDLSLMAGNEEIPTRKPFVEAQCHGLNPKTFLVLPHDLLTAGDWSSNPIASATWSIPYSNISSLSTDLNSTIVNSTLFASDSEFFGDVRPSLAAVFATPTIYHLGAVYGESEEPWPFFGCTFNARWMKTTTYLEVANPESTVYDSFPDPNLGGYASEDGSRDVSSKQAYIGKSWADLLNVPFVDSLGNPSPTNRTILDTIGQKCLENHSFLNASVLRQKSIEDGKLYYVSTDPMGLSSCLQVSLSAYLTDALSRAHNTVPIYIDVEGRVDKPAYKTYPKDISSSQSLYEDPQLLRPDFASRHSNITAVQFKDTKRFTEIKMKVSRFGYGYGFQDSILIYVGVVVLVLHSVLSLVYIAWMVCMAKIPGNDDRTIGKLLVLVMQSGSLGSSGHDFALDGDKASMKKMWKMKFGLRSVGGEEDVDSGKEGGEDKILVKI